jgi:predicted nuclease of predicted toxin-antitoxin system
VKLLLDAMWPPSVGRQLRDRGHDVVCVVEVSELRTESDESVFRYAQQSDRVVVTEDAKGFVVQAADALRAGNSHCGLVLTSSRSFPRHVHRTYGTLVTALDALVLSNEDLRGREIWLRPG